MTPMRRGKLPDWFDVPTIVRNQNAALRPKELDYTAILSAAEMDELKAAWQRWADLMSQWTR